MVHAQQVKEAKNYGKSKDVLMVVLQRLDIQVKRRFKKKFANQVLSKFSKACDDRVSNPKLKKGRDTSSPNNKLLVLNVE